VDLAEGLFGDLEQSGARFDSLVMFWLGEPLIHPHFPRIWQAAVRTAVRGRVFGKVEVHTNATHLTAAVTRGVLNQAAVPQVWHFSLDAIERDSYLQIKGMDRFEKVEERGALHRQAGGARCGLASPRLSVHRGRKQCGAGCGIP